MSGRQYRICIAYLCAEDEANWRRPTRSDWQSAQVAQQLYHLRVQLANMFAEKRNRITAGEKVKDFLLEFGEDSRVEAEVRRKNHRKKKTKPNPYEKYGGTGRELTEEEYQKLLAEKNAIAQAKWFAALGYDPSAEVGTKPEG